MFIQTIKYYQINILHEPFYQYTVHVFECTTFVIFFLLFDNIFRGLIIKSRKILFRKEEKITKFAHSKTLTCLKDAIILKM